MPDHWFSEKECYPTAAVYGFGMFLLQFIEQTNPRYVGVAFDESLGSCFRNRIYPDYKCSRVLPDESLAFQLQSCRKLARTLGLATFASKKYEADDLIATLAKRHGTPNRPVIVVSRDKDLGQILSKPQDRLWDYGGDTLYDLRGIEKKIGVKTHQIPDYLALVGDDIDDIPGLPGVGPKTAAALLKKFHDVDTLLEKRASIASMNIRGAARIAETVDEYATQLQMARKLAQLHDAAPLKTTLKDTTFNKAGPRPVKRFLKQMGFGSRAVKRYESVLGWKP
jgi:5'-3' exonuclease